MNTNSPSGKDGFGIDSERTANQQVSSTDEIELVSPDQSKLRRLICNDKRNIRPILSWNGFRSTTRKGGL